MAARISEREKYRARIKNLVANPPTTGTTLSSEAEILAHWAKYCCVLISGYIEQSMKEICAEYATRSANANFTRYVEKTWSDSKNMKSDAIKEILNAFDSQWPESFENWIAVDERKKEINEIISWRNFISHGQEAKTNNVTLHSVKSKLSIAIDLVDFLESLAA